MVYIVRKKIHGFNYLYLQKSIWNKATKKNSTKCVAYLGKEGKITEEYIQQRKKEEEQKIKEEKEFTTK